MQDGMMLSKNGGDCNCVAHGGIATSTEGGTTGAKGSERDTVIVRQMRTGYIRFDVFAGV
jgi:hypothetical protein